MLFEPEPNVLSVHPRLTHDWMQTLTHANFSSLQYLSLMWRNDRWQRDWLKVLSHLNRKGSNPGEEFKSSCKSLLNLSSLSDQILIQDWLQRHTSSINAFFKQFTEAILTHSCQWLYKIKIAIHQQYETLLNALSVKRCPNLWIRHKQEAVALCLMLPCGIYICISENAALAFIVFSVGCWASIIKGLWKWPLVGLVFLNTDTISGDFFSSAVRNIERLISSLKVYSSQLGLELNAFLLAPLCSLSPHI